MTQRKLEELLGTENTHCGREDRPTAIRLANVWTCADRPRVERADDALTMLDRCINEREDRPTAIRLANVWTCADRPRVERVDDALTMLDRCIDGLERIANN